MIEREKKEPEEFRRVGSIAQKIMLDFLIKLKKNPDNVEAMEYFLSPEYSRWFKTPAEDIISQLPTTDLKTMVEKIELAAIDDVKPAKSEYVKNKYTGKKRISHCLRCGLPIEQRKNGNRKYCASCSQLIKKELAKVNRAIRKTEPIETDDLLSLFAELERSRTEFFKIAKRIEKILKKKAGIKKSPCGDTGK